MATSPRLSLIAGSERDHDFGDVVALSGRSLDHTYRLVNESRREVKILEVVNRKSCCGVVRAEITTLHPGATTTVTVSLKVGDRFGVVDHLTDVVTDAPDDPVISLRTTATAIPPVRIEEMSPSEAVVIGPGEVFRADYRVVATGSMNEPPVDLNRATIRSTLEATWRGPKRTDQTGDRIKSETRDFSLVSSVAVTPAESSAEVVLLDSERVIGRREVRWNVAPALSASPNLLLVKAGAAPIKVLIRSRDGKPFRVTSVDTGTPGLRGGAVDSRASAIQIVVFQGMSSKAVPSREAVVATDHPAQREMKLPIVLVE